MIKFCVEANEIVPVEIAQTILELTETRTNNELDEMIAIL